MKKSITMLITAYNEEKNLENTFVGLNRVIKSIFEDYEIIIINDGSSDNTGKIADKLAKKNKIKVIHHKKNKGLGTTYKHGFNVAKKEYFGQVPGDNVIKEDSIKNILKCVGQADIIISYTINKKIRRLHRRIFSNLFTNIINLISGLNLKYYNGTVIHKTDFLKKVKMKTSSFAFQAEILTQLIKMGYSYKEVPMYIRVDEESSIFKIKNLIGILKTIIRLFFELHFKKIKK